VALDGAAASTDARLVTARSSQSRAALAVSVTTVIDAQKKP